MDKLKSMWQQFQFIAIFAMVVCLFNFSYFLWMPYNRCIIQIGTHFVLSDIVTRTIFYFIYFGVLCVTLHRHFTSKCRNKFELTKWCHCVCAALLIGVRCLFDLLINSFLPCSMSIVRVIESLFPFFVFLTIAVYYHYSFVKFTKLRIILVTALVLFAICSECFALQTIFNANDQVEEIFEFRYGFFRDTIGYVFGLLICNVVFESISITEDYYLLRSISRFLLRIVMILVLFLFMNITKYLILPHNAICNINSISDTGITSVQRMQGYSDLQDMFQEDVIPF